eukprot:9488182-Pyramimonas_sp.AAC.1
MWLSPKRRARSFSTFCKELHGLRANGFRNVALVLAPRTFVAQNLQQLLGLRAGRFQNVVLA